MVNLVREYINEKFTDESDPIKDMRIGIIHKIENWFKGQAGLIRVYNFTENKCEYESLSKDNIIINKEGKIDIIGWVDFSDSNEILPEYIRFGRIYGDFACSFNEKLIEKFMPKQIDGELRFYRRTYIESDETLIKDIKKVCKVKKDIKILSHF